jgi:hypothetical protein
MKKAFIYVDKSNKVVYADFTDSVINYWNGSLRWYQMKAEYIKAFIKYFELKIHHKALKNIII